MLFRYEEINGLIKQLKNAKKIKDIVKTNESKYFDYQMIIFHSSHKN